MIHIIRTGPLGVNSLVVELAEDRAFIVDPACCAFCGDETKISTFLEQNKKVPAAIVLTHGHFDHVAGLKILKKLYPSIPVLIHRNDADFIGANGNETQRRQLSYMGFEDFTESVSSLPPADSFLEDNSTLRECMKDFLTGLSDSVKNAIDEWKILHTPGHTMGSVCLFNQNKKLLLSGDTLFYGSYGRTDLGGSESAMRDSLRKLTAQIEKDVIVYPGHDYAGFKIGDCF